MNDEKIIGDLKDHNMIALQYVYQEYRKDFVKWASFKYGIDCEEAEDAFSDAVIDSYLNVINERYKKSETTSFKSYLFEVGENRILNILNQLRKPDTHINNNTNQNDKPCTNIFELNKNHEVIVNIKELMELLEIKCRKLLTLYYFHNLSAEEIVREMNFKNEDAAKNKKLKCLRRINHLAFIRYDKNDSFE